MASHGSDNILSLGGGVPSSQEGCVLPLLAGYSEKAKGKYYKYLFYRLST